MPFNFNPFSNSFIMNRGQQGQQGQQQPRVATTQTPPNTNPFMLPGQQPGTFSTPAANVPAGWDTTPPATAVAGPASDFYNPPSYGQSPSMPGTAVAGPGTDLTSLKPVLDKMQTKNMEQALAMQQPQQNPYVFNQTPMQAAVQRLRGLEQQTSEQSQKDRAWQDFIAAKRAFRRK